MTVHRIVLTFGEHFDRVEIDGERLDPDESLRVFNHSPSGFAWGYSGSGPAQLALAILLAVGIGETAAVSLHQRFKSEFVAPLRNDADAVLLLDVVAWAESRIGQEVW